MNLKRCDKCGRIEEPEIVRQVDLDLRKPEEGHGDNTDIDQSYAFDLCLDCWENLNDWFDFKGSLPEGKQ